MKTTQNSPWTNSIGLILVFIAAGLYVAQFFFDLKTEADNTELFMIAGAGLIIWLGFSDDLVKEGMTKFFGIKKIKNKIMSTIYDCEVWEGSVFIQGFTGPSALCDAITYTYANPLPQPLEYTIYDINSGLSWAGPRPAFPPHR